MDYNDQRRQEKSWNDPPMFSMEQLNKASNTVPVNKRYRYPQLPVQPQQQPMMQQSNYSTTNYTAQTTPYGGVGGGYPNQPQQQYQQPSGYGGAVPINNSSNVGYPNYPQPPVSTSGIGAMSNVGFNQSPTLPPQQPQQQNYPNYPPQSNMNYPSNNAIPNSSNFSSTTTTPTPTMPSPYGGGAGSGNLNSNPTLINNHNNNNLPASTTTAAAPAPGFNYNNNNPAAYQSTTAPVGGGMSQPGFNYGSIPQPQSQQQYPRY